MDNKLFWYKIISANKSADDAQDAGSFDYETARLMLGKEIEQGDLNAHIDVINTETNETVETLYY